MLSAEVLQLFQTEAAVNGSTTAYSGESVIESQQVPAHHIPPPETGDWAAAMAMLTAKASVNQDLPR
jgi:hypothetical protein